MKPEKLPTPNKWKTVSGRPIYENPWINVREDKVITPSGTNGIYGVVHFKNKAIGIVPLDEEMNTWLVGQWRYSLNEYSWEVPMGGGPNEDDPLLSAKRELLEETGLKAQRWENLGRIHTSNSVTDEEGFMFLAQELTQHEAQPDETEDLQLWKLPLSEAVEMVLDGRITDALSMAILLKTARMFGL